MMGSGMMEGFGGGAGAGAGMFFGPLLWVLVIVAAVVFVVWFTQKSGQTVSGGTHETALEILKKRYALGEINEEEYSERKKIILS